MQAKALVLEAFRGPLRLRTFDIPEPGNGEVLAKVTAAGICGSDVHIWEGKDPRTPLPIILGHEGVGEVVEAGDGVTDVTGEPLWPGQPIVWERSLTCGICPYCRRGEAYLCTDRLVYGINMSSDEPPHLCGNYADHILLRRGTAIYSLETMDDPAAIVAGTCSGSTAAHAHEKAGILPGDNIVIFGAGPVGIFQAAFAKREGAYVIVITNSAGPKADMIPEFGADDVLIRADTSAAERADVVMDFTRGVGADVVIDTTPDPEVFREAVQLLRRGGTYINSGAAVPADPIALEMYSDITSKSLTMKGVWAGDASHLEVSLELIRSSGFPFGEIVTHRFPLEEHERAWDVLRDKEGVKIIFVP